MAIIIICIIININLTVIVQDIARQRIPEAFMILITITTIIVISIFIIVSIIIDIKLIVQDIARQRFPEAALEVNLIISLFFF